MLKAGKIENDIPLTLSQLTYMTGKPVHIYKLDPNAGELLTQSGRDIVINYVFTRDESHHVIRVSGPGERQKEYIYEDYIFYNPMFCCEVCQITEVGLPNEICCTCQDKSLSRIEQISNKIEYIMQQGEIETNLAGGSRSRLDYAFTELEPEMLRRVAFVLQQGKLKYGSKNWKLISYEDHINHIYYHTIQAQEKVDMTEDHLANIICRAMFAMCIDH